MTIAEAAMSKAAHACLGHKNAKVIAQTEHKELKNQMPPSIVIVVVIKMMPDGRGQRTGATCLQHGIEPSSPGSLRHGVVTVHFCAFLFHHILQPGFCRRNNHIGGRHFIGSPV
jgi:hypothetical protein